MIASASAGTRTGLSSNRSQPDSNIRLNLVGSSFTVSIPLSSKVKAVAPLFSFPQWFDELKIVRHCLSGPTTDQPFIELSRHPVIRFEPKNCQARITPQDITLRNIYQWRDNITF
jgi:hypothetical protein